MHRLITLTLLAVLLVGAVLVGSESSCGVVHQHDTLVIACRSPVLGHP